MRSPFLGIFLPFFSTAHPVILYLCTYFGVLKLQKHKIYLCVNVYFNSLGFEIDNMYTILFPLALF